jgi:S-DNA-T family DNA segregation ATPase FtsK/SpoIIIE
VTLNTLLKQFPNVTPTSKNLTVPLAIADVPSEQDRTPSLFDIVHGSHLAIVGIPRTGRSALLRCIAGTVGEYLSPSDVHVYGIDCGNNALLPLIGLPHVGAVITRDQTDRITRLLVRLRSLISERQQQLAQEGFADVEEQRAAAEPHARLPYILVLFDRWESYLQVYDGFDGGRMIDPWLQILQEGHSAGIRMIMTGDKTLLIGRMAALFPDKLLLRLPEATD